MNSADLIKLARLFDKFIELESSFVKADEIKAIRKMDLESGPGIEIVTPHGSFMDTTDFDSFRTRINDTLALLKQEPEKLPKELRAGVRPVLPAMGDALPETVAALPNQISTSVDASPQPQLEQAQRKVVPQKSSRQVTISVGSQGAEGKLFDDPNLVIVDRENLTVSTPNGEAVLAQGKQGGVVQGEDASGFIYANGGYKLIFKKYPHKTALVAFTVHVRGAA